MKLGGKERINCVLPKEELQALNDYYNSMASVEVGDRLYERTMWYCSAENGWTIKGGAAAELYGIATGSYNESTLKGTVKVCKKTYADGSIGYKHTRSETCPRGFVEAKSSGFSKD